MTKEQKRSIPILLLYRVIYEIIYYALSSKLFAYSGLTWEPSVAKAVISYSMFFVVLLIPQRENTVSRYLVNTYFIFTIVPMLSLYWQSNRSTAYIFMCIACYLIIKVGCNLSNSNGRLQLRFSSFRIRVNMLYTLTALMFLLLFALTVKYGFADTRAFNINNVYDVRSERSFSGIWGYIINWITYAIIPCMMCVSIYRKSIITFIIAVLTQAYAFLFTGSKTVLFSIVLILLSYFIVAKKKNYVVWWCAALTVMNVATTVLYLKTKELMAFAITPIRLLTIPASISNNHYNFFSVNQKLYFAENFIGRLLGIQSPYKLFSTYLVSTGSGNANTGLLGDAYDNGGFIVMIIYSVIFVLILRLIDRMYCHYKNDDRALPTFVAILTYSIIYLNDGSLTALILTGGLFINIFVLYNFGRWDKR